MKICILTQPLHTNYGGLLQAYSLQTVLKRMGHDVLTEDRKMPKPSVKYAIKCQIKRWLGPIRKRYYPSAREVSKIRENTDRFIRENIRTTEPIYSKTKEEFRKYRFDTYIVGSDQVWRPLYSPYLMNYFLDFTVGQDVKRIAYSASFGTKEWEFSEEETRRAAELLKDFDAISVREDCGVGLCKYYFGVDAVHTLDPTMLLDKEDYLALLKSNCGTKQSGKKLMAYILDASRENDDIKALIASKLGVRLDDVIEPMPKKNFYTCGPKGLGGCVYPAVEDWLQGFAEADFVVTDSFHGTVFSIIFNVPFITVVNVGRGADRFTSLINMFDLQDRLITSYDEEKINRLIETPIDFSTVNEIRAKAKNESISFLKNALKND